MKISFILAILLTITPAKAEWLLLDTKNNYSAYLRLASITTNKNIINAWIMYDEESNQSLTHGSTLEEYQVNCSELKMKTVQTFIYSGKGGAGKLIETYTSNYNEWYFPISKTIDEAIYKYLCNLVK